MMIKKRNKSKTGLQMGKYLDAYECDLQPITDIRQPHTATMYAYIGLYIPTTSSVLSTMKCSMGFFVL